MIGYIPGVWDLLHCGHVRTLQEASTRCEVLYVGVCSDTLNLSIKGSLPTINENDRTYLISKVRNVYGAFIYRNKDYVSHMKHCKADIFICGEQFGNQGVKEHDKLIEYIKNTPYVDLVRIPYMPGGTTTSIKERIRNQ